MGRIHNSKTRRLLAMLLALVMVFGLGGIPSNSALSVEAECFTETDGSCCSSELPVRYSIEDIRQALEGGRQIYTDLRVHYDTGTVTYRVPVPAEELEYALGIQEGNIQPLSSSFEVTEIRDSGRPYADSIVIVLLGDGFEAEDYGTWPNPAPGTVLWHADRAITSMQNTHPFSLFADLFTVYVIHAHGPNHAGTESYLGTIRRTGPNTTTVAATAPNYRLVTQYGRARVGYIENLARTVATHLNMIQVIANATAAVPGWAWMGQQSAYESFLNTAVTSLATSTNPVGGTGSAWPNGTLWHGVFIHEFGHSFAALNDEHDGARRNEFRANITGESNVANVKWQHWFGHRNVLTTPRRLADGWALPAAWGANGCLMGHVNTNPDFCGVCTAELVRRMALISGETFIGRSPDTNRPLPNTPTVTIPAGASRILDSAFHGNTSLETIHIPASVTEIGDFAFIGATGLAAIHNLTTTPQQINATTFAGVDRTVVEVFIPLGMTQAFRDAGWTDFILTEPPVEPTTTAPTTTMAATTTTAATSTENTTNGSPTTTEPESHTYRYIFCTRHRATLRNWLWFFLGFGWIWMWF